MQVLFYGTRGSVPIANPQSVKYGGNSTCIRIISECFPAGLALGVDAGSGLVPMTADLLKEGGLRELLLEFSHYHHDHTQGLFLSKLLFMKQIKLRLCGPVEAKVGPREMVEAMMRPPFHPVHSREVGSHILYWDFEFPRTRIILIHPKGGYKNMDLDEFERLVGDSKHLPIGKGKYPVDECLVITMYKSNHPEATISYRFDEKPTGKVFVFLTDHENGDGIPQGLKRHLQGADLLVMDAQYPRMIYEQFTAGFGHGTPDYCARIAKAVGAKVLGLTHHDPESRDVDIDSILAEAEAYLEGTDIKAFACSDYLKVDV
jgi:ribonuclease BN (tRNA processing enzyme)